MSLLSDEARRAVDKSFKAKDWTAVTRLLFPIGEEIACSLNAEDKRLFEILARSLTRTQRFQDAENLIFRRLSSMKVAPAAFIELAERYSAAGEWPQAEAIWRLVLATRQGSRIAGAQVSLLQCLREQGKYKEALNAGFEFIANAQKKRFFTREILHVASALGVDDMLSVVERLSDTYPECMEPSDLYGLLAFLEASGEAEVALRLLIRIRDQFEGDTELRLRSHASQFSGIYKKDSGLRMERPDASDPDSCVVVAAREPHEADMHEVLLSSKAQVTPGTLDRFHPALECDIKVWEAEELFLFGQSFSFASAGNGFVRKSTYLKKGKSIWDYPTQGQCWDANEEDEIFLIIGNGVTSNYYHWVFQSMQAVHAYQISGKVQNYRIVGRKAPSWGLPYLELLGLEKSRYMAVEDNKLFRLGRSVYSNALWEDNVRAPNSALLKSFQNEILKRVPLKRIKGKKIYLSRGDAPKRKMENEADVIDYCVQHGFEVVECSKHSVLEQINILRGAEVVVAPHGAALTNLTFCRPGTRVIELFQDTYLNPCFTGIAEALDLPYIPTVHPTVSGAGAASIWKVDLALLSQAI